MLEKLKNLSMMTKLLYLAAFILFIAWVMPLMNVYYSSVNTYKKGVQEIKNISSKHGVSTSTQKFSENSFKQSSKSLFSKIDIKNLGDKLYEIHITMKKEDLKDFHTFIETISLRYYVEIKNDLEFETKDEIINVKMTVKAF